MIAIIYFILGVLMMTGEKTIFDFTSPETSGEWRIINDDVMGGVSKSRFNLNKKGIANFSGTLSPDNNGGFASVRTFFENNDLNEFTGVIINAKGDGSLYNLRFRTDQNYDGIAYQTKFRSNANKWIEYKIPFKNFFSTFRGKNVPDQPELESKHIKQIGILIADKQFGDFELNIDYIKFYKDEEI